MDARGQEGGEAVFEFTTLLSQDKWFKPTPGIRYWISISAIYGSGQQVAKSFAWLTRKNQGTRAAVTIQQIAGSQSGTVHEWPPVQGDKFKVGMPVTYPGNVPWDMAFQLISSGKVSCSSTCKRGDLNCDGVVDLKDVSILMSLWLD
jgi:hypothetical protein